MINYPYNIRIYQGDIIGIIINIRNLVNLI
jgi:hypothetical protein